MPPSIHRTSSINSTPAVTAAGARRASGPGGVLSADVARVASARRHTMPEIGARRGVDGDRAAPAPRESFRRRLETVSSRAPTPPEADSRAANARTTGAADGAGATGAAAGPSHGATSLDAARAYLAELAGDRGGALTTLVAQLNGHDRRALDHLALTVHALHLSVDDASHAKTFAGIGDALASFLAAAARANAKPGSTPRDLCVEGNKGYRKLCECVGALLRSDGIANALFGRARERGDAAADTLVSERLGGRMDGHVRTNGMVNRHGGDAQRRMADAAQRFALGARHATNLVDMVGTALELLGAEPAARAHDPSRAARQRAQAGAAQADARDVRETQGTQVRYSFNSWDGRPAVELRFDAGGAPRVVNAQPSHDRVQRAMEHGADRLSPGWTVEFDRSRADDDSGGRSPWRRARQEPEADER